MATQELVPIGTVVKHYGAPTSGHGYGKVVGYNGVPPNKYLEEKPAEAIQLAASAGLLGALVGGFYSSDRYPYVIRWNPRAEYPEGYQDVYDIDGHNVSVVEPSEVQRLGLQ